MCFDNEEYFDSLRDEEDLFQAWERFKDIRGMRELAARNHFGKHQNVSLNEFVQKSFDWRLDCIKSRFSQICFRKET